MTEYFIGMTDKGRRRERNEDTFIVQQVFNNEFLVACVIDGVGGYTGGEVAAAIARAVILENMKDLSGDVIETLRNAIVTANAKIYHERKIAENNANMACVLTCVVTHIQSNKFYYAHVGDTRLYLLRDNSLVKISKDHSVVGFLEESGRLSEEDAMRHPRRNEINKALGFEQHINNTNDYIETGESPFLPGDTILLCSDGLSDMISSNTIMSILNNSNSLTKKIQELVDAANDAGGNDNITAVLVENNKQPKLQEAVKPVERKSTEGRSKLAAVKTPARQDGATKKKSNGRLITSLALLSSVLLLALLILLFQNPASSKKNTIDPKAIMPEMKNEKLLQLIAHINDTSKTYTITADSSLLKTADSIVISKDSFYLKGNGDTIVCAANYKGPAFVISNSSKHIVLDSLVLKDFDIGIALQRNNITLKNVRFVNCRVPMQYTVLFPDSAISGRVRDSIFTINPNLKNKL